MRDIPVRQIAAEETWKKKICPVLQVSEDTDWNHCQGAKCAFWVAYKDRVNGAIMGLCVKS